MSRGEHPLTLVGVDTSTLTDEDLQAVANLAYAELLARGVDLDGVATGVARLDDGDGSVRFDDSLPSTDWLIQASLDDAFLVVRDGGERRFRVTVEETTGVEP